VDDVDVDDDEASDESVAGRFLGMRTRSKSPEHAVSTPVVTIEHGSAQRRIDLERPQRVTV
jgi:hypothetical protein